MLSECRCLKMIYHMPWILTDHLTKRKNKHLPYRFGKFDTYKVEDSKLITYGSMELIKQKDELCKELIVQALLTITE